MGQNVPALLVSGNPAEGRSPFAPGGSPAPDPYAPWIDPSAASADIAVRVIPRAKRDEVGGERAGRLLVRTTAAPVDGKANEAVCRLVAAHYGVRDRDVTVVAGHRSRDKVLRVSR